MEEYGYLVNDEELNAITDSGTYLYPVDIPTCTPVTYLAVGIGVRDAGG